MIQARATAPNYTNGMQPMTLPRDSQDLFRPQPLLRNGTVQTLLSSYRPAALGRHLAGEEVAIVDGGDDETGYAASVRLFGYYNRQHTSSESRGLVISLHGWEGCSHSIYNLTIGAELLSAGYDLFRLNVRDHGPDFHLNAARVEPRRVYGNALGRGA